MPISAAERRRVFLAYRPIFVGPNAQLRKIKKVREVVEQHRQSFTSLLKDYGLDKVVNIIKVLLEQRIFESELKAKIAFPELFQLSAARDIQRTASENNAARSEAEALEEVASLDGRADEANEDRPDEDAVDGITPSTMQNQHYSVLNNAPATATAAPQPAAEDVPSLYPSYLPFKVQHLLLTAAQHLLEEACFDFASRWLPSLLDNKRWDCPEAVELTKWTRILAKRCEKLPAEAIENTFGLSFHEILSSTNKLRHSAVHRLPTSTRGLDQMIASALRLAETIRDPVRAAQFEELHQEMEMRIKDIELTQNFLENRLEEELQVIQTQRAELDRREKEAIATMLREDEEKRALVGSFIEASVRKIFGMKSSEEEGSEGLAGDDAVGSDEGDDESIPDSFKHQGNLSASADLGYLNEGLRADTVRGAANGVDGN